MKYQAALELQITVLLFVAVMEYVSVQTNVFVIQDLKEAPASTPCLTASESPVTTPQSALLMEHVPLKTTARVKRHTLEKFAV